MKSAKKDIPFDILKIVLAISLLFFLIVLIFFLIKFITRPVPNEITKWSDFGTFISGVFGTVISLISIIILYKFSKVGELFNERTLLIQIKSSTFNSFIEVLKEIVDQFNFELAHSKDQKEITFLMKSLEFYLDNFGIEIHGLLNLSEEEEIKVKCNDLKNSLNYLRATFEKNPTFIDKEYTKLLSKFYASRAILIQTLRGSLLSNIK